MSEQNRSYPSVWGRFQREINGKLVELWVQDLTDDHVEEAMDLFARYFVRDEPICRALKLEEDENSIKFALKFWKDVAKKHCSLACFTKLDNGENKLVAINLCYKASQKDLPKVINDSGPAGQLIKIMYYFYGMKDTLKEIGVDEYLEAMGLITIPEYRGHSIGVEVLKAREPLCKVLGLKASITVFSSVAAQRQAEKVGFKDLVAMTYDELGERNPSLKIPDINQYSRYIRFMYIKYQ